MKMKMKTLYSSDTSQRTQYRHKAFQLQTGTAPGTHSDGKVQQGGARTAADMDEQLPQLEDVRLRRVWKTKGDHAVYRQHARSVTSRRTRKHIHISFLRQTQRPARRQIRKQNTDEKTLCRCRMKDTFSGHTPPLWPSG